MYLSRQWCICVHRFSLATWFSVALHASLRHAHIQNFRTKIPRFYTFWMRCRRKQVILSALMHDVCIPVRYIHNLPCAVKHDRIGNAEFTWSHFCPKVCLLMLWHDVALIPSFPRPLIGMEEGSTMRSWCRCCISVKGSVLNLVWFAKLVQCGREWRLPSPCCTFLLTLGTCDH